MSNTTTQSNFNSVDNYPPPDDTTSEGGSGGEQWSRAGQRGRTDNQPDSTGLVDQSYEGLDLKGEAQDMYQGSDDQSTEQYKKEQDRQGQGLNPYGDDSIENLRDAGERLASGITDMRGRKYESGPAASNEQDVGADSF